MHRAVFVLSTGRCGTQWLARFFEQNLGDAAVVAHEPLHSDWSPREMLGAKTPSNLDPDLREPIEEHLDDIRSALAKSMYIECGHPLWSAVPYLIATFGPDVRVIHLVRHPVPTAWSWLTHRAYCEPLVAYLQEKVLLSPFDRGVQFPEYQKRWSAMTPFEKALYYWLEVNALAERVRPLLPDGWMTLRFEDMFTAAAQRELLRFVGSQAKDVRSPGVVDELRAVCELAVEPAQIANHPAVVQLAAKFGFDALEFDRNALERRYLGRMSQ